MSIVERIQRLHYITDDDACCCALCVEPWPCAEARAAELLQRAVELLREYACDDGAACALIEEIERER